MARMFPIRPVPGAPQSELRVWDALERLPEEWRVFHSVKWQGLRQQQQADGEADFVLLHPAHGLVVLEVKGGRLSVANGQWWTVDRHDDRHRIKNPYDQAIDSKYTLVDRIRRLGFVRNAAPVSHGVVFPDVDVNAGIGLFGNEEITCDMTGLLDVRAFVTGLVDHWNQRGNLTKSQMKQITDLLAPTVEMRVTMRGRIAEAREGIVQLTDRQIEAFQYLRGNRQLTVYGGAGTGKTVLALERSRLLARDGYSVLLTCYNAPLRDYLADSLHDVPDVEVHTFHGLCMQAARELGQNPPSNPDDEWWKTDAPGLLVDAAERGQVSFDAVVIDEAQDFAPDWFAALRLVLGDSPESPLYVFGDTRQELYRSDWETPGDWPIARLDQNCRSTLPIAKRVSAIFNDALPTSGAKGLKPRFIPVRSQSDALSTIQDVVAGLLDQGLEDTQVAVLSHSRAQVDQLRQRLAGNSAFVGIGQHGVVAETIHRFKGLEADAVVVDLTGIAERPDAASAAYVGLSRARGVLIVVGDPACKRTLNW